MNQEIITLILIVVSLVSVIGVVLIGVWLLRSGPNSRMRGRISRFVDLKVDDESNGAQKETKVLSSPEFGELRNWLNDTLSVLSSEKLQIKLSSAYWPISDTEFILIRTSSTILTFALGWIIPGNILGGIFLGAVIFMIPPIILERSIASRQQKFQNQLLDVLVLIKGAVQAGYSLQQSLDLAIKELSSPSSEEFGRVLREIRLGISFEQALINLAERMESDDLQIVITAIIINAQVGGNLSTVLETTIDTIRDRMHLLGEIRSLTSYARYVGNFLTLLPFITGLIMFMVTPDYFETVKVEFITQIILVVALLGVVIGNIWIRRIVRIRV